MASLTVLHRLLQQLRVEGRLLAPLLCDGALHHARHHRPLAPRVKVKHDTHGARQCDQHELAGLRQLLGKDKRAGARKRRRRAGQQGVWAGAATADETVQVAYMCR